MSSAEPTAPVDAVPDGATSASDEVARPTVVARLRALWCQLVSGLG